MKIRTKPSKPHYSEAIIWHGDNWNEVLTFAGDKARLVFSLVDGQLQLREVDGSHYVVQVGSWIIKYHDYSHFTNIERLWFCSPEVFAKNYEVCD